jgi:glycerophosphoryl diester phosphodiesterase
MTHIDRRSALRQTAAWALAPFVGPALATAALRAEGRGVEVVAHRGESADAPENTLASFRLAWERGDDAIELDIHLTRDVRPIVCHDADTKRTTGVAKAIKESTFAELRTLDAGRWKGPQWAGERLPELGEVLATIPAQKRCFVEIKVGPEVVPAVVRALRESGKKPEQIAVISFKAPSVAEAKRQLPDVPAYLLADFKKDKQTGAWSPTVDQLIDKAKAIRADGLDLSHKGPIDADAARRIKAAGLGFYVWTVDDPAVARRMVELGAEGVTTNKAAWLKRQLKGD